MRRRPNPTVDREPTEDELKNIERVEQMLSEETPDEFPSRMRMARNLATDHWKSLKAFVKGEKVLTTQEEAVRRWKICEQCPFLKYDETNPDTGKKDGRCLHCGCFMNVKVHYHTSECPDKRW
jgi:hypothetical protein